jgi:hypothetical protein
MNTDELFERACIITRIGRSGIEDKERVDTRAFGVFKRHASK